MNDSLRKLFSDRQKCIDTLMESREIFGSDKTTREKYDVMVKALGFMLMYCSEDLKVAVENTLLESTMRRFYYETMVWNEDGSVREDFIKRKNKGDRNEINRIR